ncbi:peroxisome biogenesis factor 1 [Nephila pilipes]|uniref:Peroxisomal ATPase PEX1 n=1 Tax=Nephila pilipes TaxID=299642 RepID=A0A8X6R8H9_NEPPI|nr:peroxisome biogenesis factor 1 [Nephila pilipes]
MIETATVKFASIRGCFVNVPIFLLQESSDIHVFKLFYGDNKTAFVSCFSYRPKDKNVELLINAKFAEKLGLKENEKVCLETMPHQSIPSVQEITLEPLTSDDWEILELNAKNIEANLMNQIRVVWKGQVFPVWVNNSSFFVKVVQTNPTSQPVLLAEFSELHIVPKSRFEAKSPDYQSVVKKTPNHLQFQHLRTHGSSSIKSTPNSNRKSSDNACSSETKNTISFPFSLLSSIFPGTGEVKDQHLDNYTDFVPMNLSFILRVVPYTRSQIRSLPRVVQATTVFINVSTYVEIYGDDEIPPCFVAVLQKFSLPVNSKEKKSQGTPQQKPIKNVKNEHSNNSSFNTENKIKEEKNKSKNNALAEERPLPFQSVCVTVMVMKSSEEDEFSLPPSLFHSQNLIVIPKELKRCLNLEVSSLVFLKGIQSRPTCLNTIVLHPVINLPLNVTNEIISTNFQNWAFGNDRDDSSFVISDGTLVRLRLFGQQRDFFVSLKENSNQTLNSSYSSVSSSSPVTSDTDQKKYNSQYPKYGYLNFENLQGIQVIPGNLMCLSIQVDRPYLQKSDGLYPEIPALHLDALGGINQLVEQALENLEFWLKLRPISYLSNHSFTFSGCILICGPKGVGKSTFATALCKKLSKSHHVFVRIIHCLPLKGKRVDVIAKKWDEFITEAAYCQPSVILFEDLDYIAGSPTSHEQEVGPDGIYFANIVQTFINLREKINSCNRKIAVIVTSQSTHSLHSNLINSKGRHIFQKVIEIQPPNLEQRQEILKSLVLSKSHISGSTVDSVDWKNIASKTEGFAAQDLDSLVDRATHAAWVRMADSPGSNEIPLNLDDFQMALEGYVPSSLRGIPLQTLDYKTWNDVGGLKEVKKTIQQIIMWPIKYKQIFKSYSLKPQTNILLFGAPGTGKTLLASVIASECGLNFISIKGPELLSKYIGASEQAIRDLFKRYMFSILTNQKRCGQLNKSYEQKSNIESSSLNLVFFFDEFDLNSPSCCCMRREGRVNQKLLAIGMCAGSEDEKERWGHEYSPVKECIVRLVSVASGVRPHLTDLLESNWSTIQKVPSANFGYFPMFSFRNFQGDSSDDPAALLTENIKRVTLA